MKRKLLAGLLIFAMLFSLVPTAAFAATHTHCVCGGNTNIGDHTTHTSNQEWQPTNTLPTTAGYYYLTSDITLTEQWKPADGTYLCLNGKVIRQTSESQSVIAVEHKRTFTLTDCGTEKHKFSVGDDGVWQLDADGDKELIGGVVTGTNGLMGVYANGDAYIYNSNIVGNKGGYGGGLRCGEICKLYNVRIIGNSADKGGGGIGADYSQLQIYGGEIAHNTAQETGGGIKNLFGTLLIQGTNISYNTALENGGGVWSSANTTVNISGNTIIKENTGNSKTNNLYLAGYGENSASIDVETLGNSASVGVSADDSLSGAFLVGGKNYSDNFFSDNGAYAVVADGENLKLVCNHSANTNAPSCANTVTCSVCSGTIGKIAHHYTDLEKNDTQHWYKCSVCSEEKSDSREEHKGGTATCATQAKCVVCSKEYGSLDKSNHNYSSTWTQTTDEHYYECSRCPEMKDKAVHDYTNACDTDCNTCGYVRTITHTFGDDDICDVCGYDKTPSTNTGGGFSGDYNYPVVVADTDGADAKASESYAIEGETVTITVTPDAGKQVDEVIVTDKDGEIISVSKVGDNKYTFTMPKGKVNVSVTTETIGYDTKIVLQIGNKNVVVDGKPFANDVAPILVGDRTLVPLRVIIEALGGSVDWDEATRTVTINIDGKVLTLVIDQPIPGFGQGAAIMDNRTYIPIRYVAEYVGAYVEWIAATQQIVILK